MVRQQDSRKVAGLSLVEVLVALAIFSIVMAIAYGAILNGLNTHSNQEATVSAQAKLRRVIEVISQDVRSAVFGSIIDSPYTSGENEVSFLLLTGGAGFALAPYGLNTTQVDVISSTVGPRTGSQVVIVNQQGRAVLTRVTGVSSLSGRQRLSLSCSVPVAHTTNTLLFEVTSLGISYDEGSQELSIRMGRGAEAPFAFDISDFRVEYVYTADGEAPRTFDGPVRTAGVPERTFFSGTTEFTLSSLQFAIGTEATTRSGTRQHSYSAQVNLLSSQDFMLRELTSCI